MKNTMTKEAFWTPLFEATGGGLQPFCDWIAAYKAKVGWDNMFRPGIKFHDLPEAMQIGIISQHLSELGYILDEDWNNPEKMAESMKETLMEQYQRWCPGDCIYDSLLKVGEEKCNKCIRLDAIDDEIHALEDQIDRVREEKGKLESVAEVGELWDRIKALEQEAEKI